MPPKVEATARASLLFEARSPRRDAPFTYQPPGASRATARADVALANICSFDATTHRANIEASDAQAGLRRSAFKRVDRWAPAPADGPLSWEMIRRKSRSLEPAPPTLFRRPQEEKCRHQFPDSHHRRWSPRCRHQRAPLTKQENTGQADASECCAHAQHVGSRIIGESDENVGRFEPARRGAMRRSPAREIGESKIDVSARDRLKAARAASPRA